MSSSRRYFQSWRKKRFLNRVLIEMLSERLPQIHTNPTYSDWRERSTIFNKTFADETREQQYITQDLLEL